MKRLPRLVTLVTCVSLLASCASTTLTSTWIDKTYDGAPMKNLMVVGITETEGPRRVFEDRYVGKLQAVGVAAVSSAAVLGGMDLNKQTVGPKVQALELDGVLVTHLVGIDEEQRYNPPSAYTVPTYYGGLYGYYNTAFSYVHTPGYYSSHATVRLETNLYDSQTEKLIWSTQSRSFDPRSSDKLMNEVIGLVIADLRRRGLL